MVFVEIEQVSTAGPVTLEKQWADQKQVRWELIKMGVGMLRTVFRKKEVYYVYPPGGRGDTRELKIFHTHQKSLTSKLQIVGVRYTAMYSYHILSIYSKAKQKSGDPMYHDAHTCCGSSFTSVPPKISRMIPIPESEETFVAMHPRLDRAPILSSFFQVERGI